MTEDIREQIDRLRRDIERHNRLYYVEAAPEIGDFEYDQLLKQLEQLEAAHPEYDSPDSPSHKVGGEPETRSKLVSTRGVDGLGAIYLT